MTTLTFLGAAGTVTGSKYLLEHDGRRVLVDCGLFQGLKELRLRNWAEFPVPPRSVDAVVLTHAHLDHIGYLPRLVAQGFRGRVFCTPGTKDLCGLVLPDSGRIHEEDARQANRHGYSKHHPALPLYGESDALRALTHLQPVGYERAIEIVPGVTVEFHKAGHLLGSAFVHVRLAGGATILFGGDLGRYGRPVLPDPSPAVRADVVLVESTYGDRDHDGGETSEQLAVVIRETVARGGRLLIPSFAIGRVEELLYWVGRLEEEGRIPALPVYLDSPMAIEALRYYSMRTHELDPDLRPEHSKVCTFATTHFRTVATPDESKALTARGGSAVVISASGMATGGRVLHHLKAVLPDERNTVLFVGYQAAGTRGRKLVDGAAAVRMHGVDVPVRARIETIDSMSAHADRGEILRWLGTMGSAPGRLFLVHGEAGALEALRGLVDERLGWKAVIPQHGETVALEPSAVSG